MAFGTYIRAIVFYGRADYTASNMFYYKNTGATVIPANINSVADDVYQYFAPLYAAALTTTHSVFGVRLVFDDGTNQYEGLSNSPATPGTVSGDTLPEEDAIVLRRQTHKKGRNKRGRVFIGLVPEALQDESLLTTPGAAVYAALATAVMASIITATGPVLDPQQPDFKTAVLEPVVAAAYVIDVLNRRDRRSPKKLYAVAV